MEEFNLIPSEQRVFDLLIEGLSYKEIAKELNLCRTTVASHISVIYQKAGVDNSRQLLAWHYKRVIEGLRK